MNSKLNGVWKRLADRDLAIQKRKAQAASLLTNGPKATSTETVTPQQVSSAESAKPAPQTIATRAERPWAHVRSGDAGLKYEARTTHEQLALQPWTNGLVSTLLAEADQGGIALCLVWPAKLTSLPLIHALANVERLFAKDLRGVRTLHYPGNHASRAPLHSVLADRQMLSDFYRALYVQKANAMMEETNTSSPAFLAALQALNEVRIRHSELPNPSLAELVPTFVFDPVTRAWATTVSNPLERTLSKIDRLAFRRDVRQNVGTEWAAPEKAPGALMVLHHSAKKDAWRTAFAAPALKGQGQPEVLLLDATDAASKNNYSAVKRIPDFLLEARKLGLADAGAVIVTDDPKTFFILRTQLHEMKLAFSVKVWAAEADEVLLSAHPVASDWKPTQRSNSNFSVSIVDRDASQVALAFQRLMDSAGSEESPSRQALLNACLYILRLSNMPAGYTDLTAVSTAAGETNFGSMQNAWAPLSLALLDALASGALNAVRANVQQAISSAEGLIDNWNDATPMAARMLAEVRKHAVNSQQGISIVLPNNKYVQLAHRFLKRKLGDEWAECEAHIEWHTLSAVAKTLAGDRKGKHFAFVGVNQDVLRILISHPAVPHGTAVLVAYRQAESTLQTLMSMKELDAFKAYRGRIGLLAQELERRLAEVPRPIAIGKLREMPMTFKFDENGQDGLGEQTYYKFELEGGGRAFSSGWVYRHVPDEDPPFRRAAASSIHSGDFIFDMSDELRAKLESTLHLDTEGASSVVDPVRMFLKLYHADVQTRCALMCKSTRRSAMAREIYSRMVEIDPIATECQQGRVYYWLDLRADGDTRPHASKDAKFFKIFCKALGVSDDTAEQNWAIIRNARQLSQYLGRVLVARYAEVLFQPESAAIYRKVPEDIIKRLQQEALRCVYRVESVIPPSTRITTSKKGEMNAHP